MSNIRVISNNTQFKGMVEMVSDANLLETGAVGDLRRAVHADDDPAILPLEEWGGTRWTADLFRRTLFGTGKV